MKIDTFGPGDPVVTFVVGVHGDEHAPVEGVEILKDLVTPPALKKGFRVITANEEALAQGTRFVDCDLNRSFPGLPHGRLEERLADRLRGELERTPFVFDFHTTTFSVPPYAVVSIYSDQVARVLAAAGVLTAVFDSSESLIKYSARAAAIECGFEGDGETARRAAGIMQRLLWTLDVAGGEREETGPEALNVLLIYQVIEQKSFCSLCPSIRDFQLVEKGEVIGTGTDGEEVAASENFYPVWVNHPTHIRKAKRISIEE